MINAEWLAAFVRFAETMNFTHAARTLHISQPALHVQIRKLGESVGAPLYARRGRMLELTIPGRRVLVFAREQQERTDEFLSELGAATKDATVVLAAGEGTFMNLLSDPLRAFQRARQTKHVNLRVLTRDAAQAISAVQLGEAHLAVTVVDDVPSKLVARKVADVGAAVVLLASHRLAKKHFLSIRDLSEEPLIVPSPGRPLRATLSRAWAAAGVPWSPAVEANGWELMMRFVEIGLGIAVVNDFCKPPRGTVIRKLAELPSVRYQLLRLRDRRPGEDVLALEESILRFQR